MGDILEAVLSEMSAENMFRHIEVLSNEIGERLSGSPEIARAAEYIEGQLIDAGLSARIDRFPLYHSAPLGARLKVLAPETATIDTRPVCHISSTAPSGIEGELLYAGTGGYDSYAGLDAANRILLVNMNGGPCRPEKARIAWEKGAKALIIMNYGKTEDNIIQMGGVKSQWGNPAPDTFDEVTQITAISVSRASGEYLKELCQRGNVRAWLSAESTREWVPANQVTGFVKGGESNGQFVLVGGHLDAWGKSAVCNSSGNAMTIELARLFSKYRSQLKRDMVFAFWDGHEIGECAGSTWYCDSNWDKLTSDCVAYVNLDGLANRGTTVPGVTSVPEMKSLFMDTVSEVWKTPGVWRRAYRAEGDASFYGVGVPFASFMSEYSEEMMKELNNAFYGPWLHTDDDTVDKIDKELYIKHFEYFSNILCRLVNCEILPYDLEALAEDVSLSFQRLLETAGESAFIIESLEPLIDGYRRAAKALQNTCAGSPTNAAGINRALIKWTRETSAFRNIAGRYAQDAYGITLAEKPFPALYEAIAQMNAHTKDSHEYNLWSTKAVREKNRVSDALNNSIQYAEFTV